MWRVLGDVRREIGPGGPLVRPTRNQAEIDLLPPYGDPEVHIPSEAGTYLLAVLLLAEVLDRLGAVVGTRRDVDDP